jgi:retron-type reverse transcriptase
VKDRTQTGNAGSSACPSTMTQRGVEATRSGESLIPKGVDLLELMLSRENMSAAWKRVRANRGAAGVDGESITDVSLSIHQTWEGIKRSIEVGTYRPAPVLRTFIPKGNGETRPLGIPTPAGSLDPAGVGTNADANL